MVHSEGKLRLREYWGKMLIFVYYWLLLSFAAKLLEVKLSYDNCIEYSLLVKRKIGVNTYFVP